MKISAITVDQIIIIDGVVVSMADSGGFLMERGEWALHFDTALGVGEIEYIDKRANQRIDAELFKTAYAWLITEHERAISQSNSA